jgi:putative acetyltransferase
MATAAAALSLQIRRDDLRDPRIEAFMREHLADMHRTSPPESVHALDMGALRRPEIEFFTAWSDDTLVATGAIKRLDAERAELKSMRTAESWRGRGAGRQVLAHLIRHAQRLGLSQLLLETGTAPFFDPAVALYRRYGFIDCGPFADYRLDPHSRYMVKTL